MLTVYHLGLVVYEPSAREAGIELQPALWCAVGGCVTVATAKEHKDLGYTRRVRVLTRDGRPWLPGSGDNGLSAFGSPYSNAKHLIAADRLRRAETLFVTQEAYARLERHPDICISTSSPRAGTVCLFAAAKQTHVFTHPKNSGLDRRTDHWSLQGSGYGGEKGNYLAGGKIRELKEGWNPDSTPSRWRL